MGLGTRIDLWASLGRVPPDGAQTTSRFFRYVIYGITRGNRRAVIVHNDADATAYLERLERYRVLDSGKLYSNIEN